MSAKARFYVGMFLVGIMLGALLACIGPQPKNLDQSIFVAETQLDAAVSTWNSCVADPACQVTQTNFNTIQTNLQKAKDSLAAAHAIQTTNPAGAQADLAVAQEALNILKSLIPTTGKSK